jgi:type II secretory pathway pseudopilin PulG
MLHRNHLNHSSGFTIAEMIIVLGIMVVLSTVGTRTYLTERDRFEFNNALTKTMQLVKTVRTYATTSYPIYIEKIRKNIIPLDGYGIQVNLDPVQGQSTLRLFANIGPESLGYQKDDFPNVYDDNDVTLETYTLPKQINFKYYWFKEDGGTDKKMWKDKKTTEPVEPAGPTAFESDLVFRPPLGDMTITGIDKTDATPKSLNLEQLSLQFENPASDATGPKKYQKIIINRVRAFPELTYSSTLP